MISLIESIRKGTAPSFQSLFEALASTFPVLNELEGTEQEPDWHTEGNVLVHTKMVYEDLVSGPNSFNEFGSIERVGLLVGAVLHDIGKARTTKRVMRNGRERIASPGHEAKGMEIVAEKILGLEFDPKEAESILSMIAYHGEPKKIAAKNESEQVFREFAQKTSTRSIHRLCEADLRGRICSDFNRQIKELNHFKRICIDLAIWK